MASPSEINTYAKLLDLVPAVETGPGSVEPATPRERPIRPRATWRSRHFLFWVVLPTVLGALFFGLILSDRYEAEGRFVIRSSTRVLASSLTNLLQNAGVARPSDEAYAVREYMLSRDAMSHLVTRHGLREAWDRPGADFFWRFPNFYTPGGEEGRFKHYQRLISVKYDPTSGVSTLRVEAFNAADARELARGLMEAAEGLVNRLNERASNDAWALARKEVAQSEERTRKAQAALSAFRSREAIIDPMMVSIGTLETIARLSIEQAETNLQLVEAQRSSPHGPQVANLRARIAAIEDQIKREHRRLAGDDTSLSARISEYEQLALAREFAERALVRALAAVDLARIDAQRQQIYLERVAEPQVADYPAYPYRILSIIAVFLISLLTYRVAMMFANDVRLHARG